MSVCRKHRRQGRTACACRMSRSVGSDGYGGPDVSGMTSLAFDSLSDLATSGFGSTSYDSGSSGGSSSDYGSSSSSSSDSGSSYSGGSDSGSW